MTDGNRTNWNDFDEYLRQGEPDTQEKASNWQTAIGLQAVDGLQPSDYLLKAAKQHIARFVSGLWQVHAFRESNTRTTAVFAIQYLRSIGFNINNELFARHSWYFRNALVRTNYRNIQLGINYDFSFLIKFFRNLLMGENHELRNRFMVINQPDGWAEQQATPQVPPK